MNDYCSTSPNPVTIFADKDPNSIEDFAFNWAPWLDGDIIATSLFLLPDGLTQASSYFTETKAVIYLSGGTAGAIYRVTSRITTAGGRSLDKTIYVRGADQ